MIIKPIDIYRITPRLDLYIKNTKAKQCENNL